MGKTLIIGSFSAIWVLCNPSVAHSQHQINLKNYFFPQTPQQYTLKYSRTDDTAVVLTKTVKQLGSDTIEVSDYGRNNDFHSSLKFVITENVIRVIQSKAAIKSKVFLSEIKLDVWAQNKSRKNKMVQLDIRTEDTCVSPSSNCYWNWFRHKQVGLKKSKIMWNGKLRNTLTFSFTELELYQPRIFSSISGLSKSTKSYVFAEGVGLIKIITTIKKINHTNTLILQK